MVTSSSASSRFEVSVRYLVAPRADGIEHDRYAGPVRGLSRGEHRLDPLVREGADVQHER
jgi:hypothetical protein